VIVDVQNGIGTNKDVYNVVHIGILMMDDAIEFLIIAKHMILQMDSV